MKQFTVIYDIKAHGNQWTEGKLIEAETPAEAKKLVKELVKRTQGSHTFDLVAKAYEDGLTVKALTWETAINRMNNELKSSEADVEEYKAKGSNTAVFERHVNFCHEYLEKYINEAMAEGMTISTYKNGRYCIREH